MNTFYHYKFHCLILLGILFLLPLIKYRSKLEDKTIKYEENMDIDYFNNDWKWLRCASENEDIVYEERTNAKFKKNKWITKNNLTCEVIGYI